MRLITALTLIGAGYFFVPLFIESSIILPIIPVMLAGVAIIALTKFYFNIRPEAFLDKIMTNNGSNENEVDINSGINRLTQEIKETIKQATFQVTSDMSKKVDKLAENTQSFFSTFYKPPQEDSAGFHHNERVISPSHS